MTDLIERLQGPHQWGYRDPVTGDFIADDGPHTAADRITALEAENARLREGLEQIRDRDWIEALLDPQWPSQTAAATLKNKDTTSHDR